MKDIVSKYSKQASELEQIVSNCSAEAAGWKPDQLRWSILEISGHLADAELLASDRIRRLIVQDRPHFYGYNQMDWAEKLGYQSCDLAQVAKRLVILRQANAALLENIADDVWNQTGTHDQYGVMSLRQWIEDYVGHMANHLDQMRGIIKEFKQGKPEKGKLNMAKSQDTDKQDKEPKGKDRKNEGRKALIGRVKKAVKKSRRKMSEEKFERELQRTITFLEGLQARIGGNGSGQRGHRPAPAPTAAPGFVVETEGAEDAPPASPNSAAY